jgi:tetratricopeptide (TPR) repeat protein
MGKLWQDMLTEGAGHYIEIQAGKFATQSDFELLMPHELIQFTEAWIPVAKTDGFVKAHPEGIISINNEGNISSLAIQSTRRLDDAVVRLSSPNGLISDARQSFEPGQVCRFEAPCVSDDLFVEIFDSSGNLILKYEPKASRPKDTIPRTSIMLENPKDLDEILQNARACERTAYYRYAREGYRRLLDTKHAKEARKGLARLSLTAGYYEEAATYARAILESSFDPDATAYLALALQDSSDALRLWKSLTDDPTYTLLARRQIALDVLRRGDFTAAIHHAEAAEDPVLNLISAISYRRACNPAAAGAKIDAVLDADPLWRTAVWESSFLHPDEQKPSLALESFQEDMDAIAWYLEIGMTDEARSIVEAWIRATPPDDPFLRIAADDLKCKLPGEFQPDQPGIVNCFAHRDVFMRIAENHSDPESQLHLGNMLYSRRRVNEAISKWRNAAESGHNNPMPYRNLALASWYRKGDFKAAYSFMRQAVELAPNDTDILRDLDILAELSGAYEDRLEIAKWIMERASDNSSCVERAARAFLEAEKLDDAIHLLTTNRFFVMELACHTRLLYVIAHLRRGAKLYADGRYADAADDFRKATESPANLGAARWHGSSDAQAFYLLGLALKSLGKDGDAEEAWTAAASDTPRPASEQAFYVGRARESLGRADAKEAFDAIIQPAHLLESGKLARARQHYLLGLHALSQHDSMRASHNLRAANEVELQDATRMHSYLELLFTGKPRSNRIPVTVWWTVEPQLPNTEK